MRTACIVLPTYNEAENVRLLVPRIFAETRDVPGHEIHVLVVDDSSPDGTEQVVRQLMATNPRLHVVSGAKRGLGVAYRRGFSHALQWLGADLVLQMDADLQHPPALLPLFLRLADEGYDVVIGSRFAPGGATPRFSWRRRLASRLGNALVRTLGGLPPLHDCTSGFRCIRADLLRRCDLSFLATRGYAFQTSLLGELLRQGARPIEVPMVFGERTYGASKLGLRDQLEFLGNLVRLRLRRLLAWGYEAWRQLRATGRRRAAGGGRALGGVAPPRPPRLASSGPPRPATAAPRGGRGGARRRRGAGRAVRGAALPRFVRFAGVGASGVVVNLLALWALAGLAGIREVPASAIAVEVSIVWNFLLNNAYTYRDRNRAAEAGLLGRLARYNLVSLVGLGIQLGAFVVVRALVLRGLHREALGGLRYLAQCAGILLALGWSFAGNLHFTWKQARPPGPGRGRREALGEASPTAAGLARAPPSVGPDRPVAHAGADARPAEESRAPERSSLPCSCWACSRSGWWRRCPPRTEATTSRRSSGSCACPTRRCCSSSTFQTTACSRTG